ncbi:MAG: hypothetical protein LBF40_08165 [Deltaproteobacteria bacterium]|jgi:hypothetical protein|nr:hypothetical protein [Deltaproteobacteria bacterium]
MADDKRKGGARLPRTAFPDLDDPAGLRDDPLAPSKDDTEALEAGDASDPTGTLLEFPFEDDGDWEDDGAGGTSDIDGILGEYGLGEDGLAGEGALPDEAFAEGDPEDGILFGDLQSEEGPLSDDPLGDGTGRLVSEHYTLENDYGEEPAPPAMPDPSTVGAGGGYQDGGEAGSPAGSITAVDDPDESFPSLGYDASLEAAHDPVGAEGAKDADIGALAMDELKGLLRDMGPGPKAAPGAAFPGAGGFPPKEGPASAAKGPGPKAPRAAGRPLTDVPAEPPLEAPQEGQPRRVLSAKKPIPVGKDGPGDENQTILLTERVEEALGPRIPDSLAGLVVAGDDGEEGAPGPIEVDPRGLTPGQAPEGPGRTAPRRAAQPAKPPIRISRSVEPKLPLGLAPKAEEGQGPLLPKDWNSIAASEGGGGRSGKVGDLGVDEFSRLLEGALERALAKVLSRLKG